MLRSGLRRFAAPLRAQAVAAPSPSSFAASGSKVEVSFQNLETKWPTLSAEAKEAHHAQLVQVLKGDWKKLSFDEKKASLFLAYGSNTQPPSDTPKVIFGTALVVGISVAVALFTRTLGKETPITMTKEWQEDTNKKMLAQKANPITGISSEGYKGKGFVQ